MASEAQIAANRRNAQASTGPRTEEGKARVARNGLKHGLCAREAVLPWEDRTEFESLVADLSQRFEPTDATELALLHQMADAMWRRSRCPTLETGMLADAMPVDAEGCPEGVAPTVWALGRAWRRCSKEVNRLSLHESRLDRICERALGRLLAVQAERRRREAELALDSRTAEIPSPAAAGEGGDPSRSDGEGEGQGTASTLTPSSAPRPDPHPNPLPQEREREQIEALDPELALLSRKAA